MDQTLCRLFDGFQLTGILSRDAPAFLRHHGRDAIARHVELAAANARAIARQVGADKQAAVTAAWLHDISRVIPGPAMVEPARRLGLDLVQEELALPELIHGKLSAVMAELAFGITDPVVLDAIRCHTTLRPNPTLVDRVLFIADKLAWAPHEAPYHAALTAALDRSLDEAVACFLDWAWRQQYKVIHPWLREAYRQFCTPETGYRARPVQPQDRLPDGPVG